MKGLSMSIDRTEIEILTGGEGASGVSDVAVKRSLQVVKFPALANLLLRHRLKTTTDQKYCEQDSYVRCRSAQSH